MKRTTVAGLALLLVLPSACASKPAETDDLRWRKSRAHYDMGLEHMTRGRLALAIREFRIAEDHDDSDPWVALALAEAHRRKGLLEDAERHLQRALELDPSFQAAQLNLSALYIQGDRYEEAIPLLTSLTEDPTFPAPWRALTNLGWAEFKLGRYADARRHLDRALDFDHDYWPALLNLGILEAQEGHRVEALGYFERVLARNPGPRAEAEAHYRMAEIYISLGRREKAITHLTASHDRHPRSLWGKRSAEYLKILR